MLFRNGRLLFTATARLARKCGACCAEAWYRADRCDHGPCAPAAVVYFRKSKVGTVKPVAEAGGLCYTIDRSTEYRDCGIHPGPDCLPAGAVLEQSAQTVVHDDCSACADPPCYLLGVPCDPAYAGPPVYLASSVLGSQPCAVFRYGPTHCFRFMLGSGGIAAPPPGAVVMSAVTGYPPYQTECCGCESGCTPAPGDPLPIGSFTGSACAIVSRSCCAGPAASVSYNYRSYRRERVYNNWTGQLIQTLTYEQTIVQSSVTGPATRRTAFTDTTYPFDNYDTTDYPYLGLAFPASTLNLGACGGPVGSNETYVRTVAYACDSVTLNETYTSTDPGPPANQNAVRRRVEWTRTLASSATPASKCGGGCAGQGSMAVFVPPSAGLGFQADDPRSVL